MSSMRKKSFDNDRKNEEFLLPHFSELRKRILHTFIFLLWCLCCSILLVDIYSIPLLLIQEHRQVSISLLLSCIPFFVPLRLVLFLTFLISAPHMIYQMLSFMAPGLYENEKNFIFTRSVIGALLFSAVYVLLFHCSAKCF